MAPQQARGRSRVARAVCICLLLSAVAPAGTGAQSLGALNTTCLEDLAANISRCYDEPDAKSNVALKVAIPVIRSNIIRLILECSQTSDTSSVLKLMIPVTTWAGGLVTASTNVLNPLNLFVNFTAIPLVNWPSAPLLDVQNALARDDGSYGNDAWLLDPQIAGSMADLGALQDLSGVVQDDASLNWTDIHPFYRGANANYGGKVLMLPISGAMWMMYVRRDVLASRGLSVPVTWEQLIQVAAAVNGTDMNKDGVKDAAICFQPCMLGAMISSIWASIVQTQGVHQGLFYDVDTMQVMASTDGFAAALQLFQRMYAYAAPLPKSSAQWTARSPCAAYQSSFSDGGCAFTFGWMLQFKRNSYGGVDKTSRYVRGLVTTAPLPGSTTIFNRASSAMEQCTAATCPFATVMQASNGSTVLVNLAPYTATGGISSAVNAMASVALQYYAYSALSYVSYPVTNTLLQMSYLTEVGPVRLSVLDETLMASRYNLTWTSYGYDESDVTSVLATLNAGLAHPNIALDCRLPNTLAYSNALETAAFVVSSGRLAVAAVMANTTAALQAFMPTSAAGIYALQQAYWVSLNIVLAPPPPSAIVSPPRPGSENTFFSSKAEAVPVLTAAGFVGLVLVATLGYLFHHQRRGHRSLWGRVLAPGAGPLTTLLVTDIESSTTLWETFEDPQVMDSALRMHHEIIRRLLILHAGYETATEGDSFIVAFHCPRAALNFALAAQLHLLEAPWPAELDGAPASRGLWSAPARDLGGPGADGGKDGFLLDASPTSPTNFFSVLSANITGGSGHLHVGVKLGSGAFSAFNPAWRSPNSRVREALAARYPTTECSMYQGRAAPKVHRGIRVRIGLHSGVPNEADVNVNVASGRTTFSGEPLSLAKAVGDCAHGGQVLYSETSHAHLCEKSEGGGASCSLPCLILHAGLHVVKDGYSPLHVYMALSRPLIARAALFPPLRSLTVHLPGVLDAPLGVLAVAAVTLTGASALLAWDLEEATHAISVFQACCGVIADEYNGFVTEQGVGEMVGVFPTCPAAVSWSLHVIEALKRHAWSEVLLTHPLCEDLSIAGPPADAPDPGTLAGFLARSPEMLKLRGLRRITSKGKPPPALPTPPPGGFSSRDGASPPLSPPMSPSQHSAGGQRVSSGGPQRHSGFGAAFAISYKNYAHTPSCTQLMLAAMECDGAGSSSHQTAEQRSDVDLMVDLEPWVLQPPASPAPPAPPALALPTQPTLSGFSVDLSSSSPQRPASSVQQQQVPTSQLQRSSPAVSGHQAGPLPSPGMRSSISDASALALFAAVDATRASTPVPSSYGPRTGSGGRRASYSTPPTGGGGGGFLGFTRPGYSSANGAEDSGEFATPRDMAVRMSRASSMLLVFRGPRVRAGVAVGDVSVDVSATSGRLSYRGKAASLAARIAETARSSQVLCSVEVCEGLAVADKGSYSSISSLASSVVYTPIGRTLRSIQERTALYSCRFRTVGDDLVPASVDASFSALGTVTSLERSYRVGDGDLPSTHSNVQPSCPLPEGRMLAGRLMNGARARRFSLGGPRPKVNPVSPGLRVSQGGSSMLGPLSS